MLRRKKALLAVYVSLRNISKWISIIGKNGFPWYEVKQMNLHLIFRSGQVLNISWGVPPSGISQEESPPIGGSAARLLEPRRRSPSPGTKLCRSLAGLSLSFVFGLEAEPRPAECKGWRWSLCCCLHTGSAPDGCIHTCRGVLLLHLQWQVNES